MLPLHKRVIYTYYLLLSIGFLITTIFIFTTSASNNIIYVDSTNTEGPWNGMIYHPFLYIQDAVDAADTNSIISIAEGIYTETVTVQKNLLFLGEKRDTTIIEGNSDGHVIHIQGSAGKTLSIELSSLTIKNAQGLGYDCIALSYVKSGSITDSILMNSAQSDGIQLDHCSDITIANNHIKNNNGAGISLTLSSNNNITNNIIQNNQKGVYVYLSSNSNIIRNNQINENTQYGLYIVQSSNNYIYLNDFSNNGNNAQDSSINLYYYAGEGNYWDDYNNYDKDPLDGIGDVSYSISGGSNKDIYPLGYFLEVDPPESGNKPPTAYIPTIYPTLINLGEEVTFSGGGKDADGYIVAYYWRSSIDGFINDQKSFSSSDLSPGAHQIYLKVRDNDGEWSSEKSTSLIVNNTNNDAPIALIIYVKPDEVYSGERVYFNGQGIDSDGKINNYKWVSNQDGIIGQTNTFSTNTLSPGTHTISFQVQDDKGKWSSIARKTITILYYPDPSHIVVNTGGPYKQDTFKVKFDASKSIGGSDFFWDYGDGTFGSGKTSTHQYSEPGNYSVTLTITNEEGNTSSALTFVNISELAWANDSPQNIDSLSFEIPMELIIIVQVIIVIGCVGFFFLWMKHK